MIIRETRIIECWCPHCGAGQVSQILQNFFENKEALKDYIGQKGDIIVMLHKKDGSIGLDFEYISDYSGLTSWIASNWLAEGETPQDNILTKKTKLQSEII